MNHLLYRRQFILINRVLSGLDSWKKETISSGNLEMNLYCHPDLNLYRANAGPFQLVGLGYLLDPTKPGHTDQNVMEELSLNRSFDEVVKNTERLCGRFVLMFYNDQELKILHDAVGFREVYYALTGDLVAVGSTPNLLAEYTGLPGTRDPDILEFHQSEAFIQSQSNWLGTRTLFENIMHLLPNHYLDVNKKTVIRYWPDERLEKIGLHECAAKCAKILRGTIESALNRYNIHMGMTAGWDTRLLLSSTKDFRDRIFYYLNRPRSFPPDHMDLVIAKRLAGELDLELNVLDIPDTYDREFAEIFFKNNVLAREMFLPLFNDVHRRGWEESFTLSGTMGNGLARIYMRFPGGVGINGENVARVSHFHHLKYAVSALDNWVEEIKHSLDDWNINIMDLYQMEQENSHWAALSSSEQDIVREEIRPFNNRLLTKLFWSLEDKHRYQYYSHIYLEIMKILWKEVLRVPINPSRRTRLYRVLRHLGLEQRVYKYYKRRQFMSAGH